MSESVFPDYSARYAPVVLGGILAIAAVIVTFLWGSKTLARFDWDRLKFRERRDIVRT